MKNAIVLVDVRSIQNVGSIFRTAECAGIGKAWLAGYTPAPVDRFGRYRKDFAKVSLGAERSLEWESVSDAAKLVKRLKKQGYLIVAVEQSPDSVDYKKVKLSSAVAFVFGNEVGGIPERILKLCDAIVEIPMKGEKESLNVAVSVGVSLFRMLGI